jgi:succinate dehydrogenase / fumarate reductase membrane anchor subunit
MSDMTNPLAKARGHGSAKAGVHHWMGQRISAVLLLLLIPWMLYALVNCVGSSHAETVSFVSRPLNASLLILSLLVLIYHAVLGLQTVIEDYVHRRAVELLLHFSVRASAMLGACLGVVYILKLTLGA